MLTADLVRARRKGTRLELVPLNSKSRARAIELAADYVAVVNRGLGENRAALREALADVTVTHREQKLAAGLRKLLEDRCTFEVDASFDPVDLRREVFLAAAAMREQGESFSRETVLQQVAEARSVKLEILERGLFADLKSEHRLTSWREITPSGLVAEYEVAQAQAVLLRAVEVRLDVRCSTPSGYRNMFRRLKFLRLLYRIEGRGDRGYRLTIDGPFNLFSSATKYGLQLALMLPVVRECDEWSLVADVRWGKDREALTFELHPATVAASVEAGPLKSCLPDEVEAFRRRFESRESVWRVEAAEEILTLPGVGECVPDLRFVHRETGQRVLFEVLGFWSRDAVWRRVELARRGLSVPIVFGVPRRLRVSEAVLNDDELPAALYVYKGVISPSELEFCLEQVAKRADN